MRCPVCGSTYLIKDDSRGEIYCSNCGYVFNESDYISVSMEYNVTHYFVGNTNEMSNLNRVPPTLKTKYNTLNVIQKRLTTSKERKLLSVFDYIHTYSEIFGIPHNNSEDAKFLAKRYISSFNKVRDEMVALALIIVELKKLGRPIRKGDFLRFISEREFKRIMRLARFIVSEERRRNSVSESIWNEWYFVVKEFGLNYEQVSFGESIIKMIEDKFGMEYKSKWVTIGGILDIIRIVYGLQITQKDIANKVGVSPVGIRLIRNKILKDVGIHLDNKKEG